jgi:hypothetical protein
VKQQARQEEHVFFYARSQLCFEATAQFNSRHLLLSRRCLFVSPWLFAYANGVVRLDFWISGSLIAGTSAVAILAFSEWEDWLNLALGPWLVSAPWSLGFAHTRAMHMSIAIGCLVAYLAALELWLAH